MAKVIITVLYTLFKVLIQGLMAPVLSALDTLITNLGLTQYFNLFYSILSSYIAPMCGFFFEFLGPNTISIIALEIGAYVAFYTISMALTGIIKALRLIKKFVPLA